MSFKLNGFIEDPENWEDAIIEVCLSFYQKYNCYPNFIRMNDETLDSIFDLMEIRNCADKDFRCFECEENEEIEYEFDEEGEDSETYPVYFGPNTDCTVSFITNHFELKFLEGKDLFLNTFVVQFGNGSGDDGEEIEGDDSSIEYKEIKVA